MNIAHKRTPSTISRQMCILERSVRRYLKLFEQTGDVKLKSARHGPQLLLGEFKQLTLLRLFAENTGTYPHELQDRIRDLLGVTVSVPTICRTLRIIGCCKRVIRHIVIQRSEEECVCFMAHLSVYGPAMIILIDDSSCDRRNSTRKLRIHSGGSLP